MKIAIVLPGGVDRGGEYRVIPAFLALIGRLAIRHDVHVFVLHQEPLPATWPLRGATIHNVGAGWTRWRTIAAIRAEHRHGRFDLVHAIFSGACSLIAVVAAMWLRIPSMVHIAGGELVALYAISYGGRQKWRGRLREAVILRATDAVTAASTPIIASLKALGIPARRIPLGVDLEAWPPCAPRARGSGPARLIHVASVNRVKDQTSLLRALAILVGDGVEFTMDIVGVDTLHGDMATLVGQLGLGSHVRFVGFHTQRDLRPRLITADLLVMSSLHEAGPLVLLEAAVVGVPAVGTRVGHFVEWTPAAALAVPVGDAVALAAAIRRVVDDDALRLRLATQAQRRAIDEDADHTARLFEALYREVLERRNR